jgi:hypothetical protein
MRHLHSPMGRQALITMLRKQAAANALTLFFISFFSIVTWFLIVVVRYVP